MVSVFDFVVSRIPKINSITPFEYVFVIDGISAHEIKIDFILFSFPRTLRSVSNLYSDWPEGVSTHRLVVRKTDTLQANWSFFEEFEAVEILKQCFSIALEPVVCIATFLTLSIVHPV